jgi:predicted dehydrogenase
VERFNPAFLALKEFTLKPSFIEVHRLAQWNPRGTDVSVVLDLMIHDIDIVLRIVNSEVRRISANGVAVISTTPDIANARIEFTNGCVANLTASRISMKNMRKMRIFQPHAYVSVDFLEKKSEIFSISDTAPEIPLFQFTVGEQTKYLTVSRPEVPEVNAIREELLSFAQAIQTKSEPPVTILDALKSIRVAQEIMERIMPE